MKQSYDRVVIGAGLYGLYFALLCCERNESVLVLEKDPQPFMRATYINQARVHMGYHYPRSYSTAVKSRQYFERFVEDFGFCIYQDFSQVYATSSHFSWTDQKAFRSFCDSLHIRCEAVSPELYFQPGMCDGAFLTQEYTYDAMILKEYLLKKLAAMPKAEIVCSCPAEKIRAEGDLWHITAGGSEVSTPFILNAAYASVNDIHKMAGFEPFRIKYEKCEIILCRSVRRCGMSGSQSWTARFSASCPSGRPACTA